MNELSTDVNYGEMKAELQALRKKVEDLESKQAAYKGGTDRTVRRRFPKRLVIASVSLAAMLVAGGLLWGQGAIQALFIDEKGNVGIGTTSPTVRLDVAGGPRAAFYPGTKQPISLTARALYVTGDLGQLNGVEFRHSNGTQGIGFGYDSVYATGDNKDQNLNLMPRGTGKVGIGKLDPGAMLDVKGDALIRRVLGPDGKTLTAGNLGLDGQLTAGSANVTGNLTATSANVIGSLTAKGALNAQSGATITGRLRSDTSYITAMSAVEVHARVITGGINGEKEPMRLEIPSGGYFALVRDIKEFCVGENGCRIRVVSRKSNDFVPAEYEILFAQQNGTKGATWQIFPGNARTNWELDTPDKRELFTDSNGCRAANYATINQSNVPGASSNVNTSFRGNDKYKIVFSCPPGVTANFAVYGH
ncbi:MAG: hypothetical protein WAM65_10275 [Candidatus Korobacteraceae bacterium]